MNTGRVLINLEFPNAIVFIALHEASFITGHVLNIDIGRFGVAAGDGLAVVQAAGQAKPTELHS
jgi:hypothetical protein